MGRLPPHGERRHPPSPRRVPPNAGHAGRACGARATREPPRLSPRWPGRGGAAARDAPGPGRGPAAPSAPRATRRGTPQRAAPSRRAMASARPRRGGSRPRHRRRPARPAGGCQGQTARRGPRMTRSLAAGRRTTGRPGGQAPQASGASAARGPAARWRPRERRAPGTAAPASLHPPTAPPSVGTAIVSGTILAEGASGDRDRR